MEVTEDIPKPERDARLYSRITFPNGLEALLISDPSLVRAPSPDRTRRMLTFQPVAVGGGGAPRISRLAPVPARSPRVH